nr:carboxy terminal-processing peptidase [Luminiphilus syltensis]
MTALSTIACLLAGRLGRLLTFCGASLLFVFPAYSLEPTPAQGETLEELVDALEDRHYAKRVYDDSLSRAHLNEYIDSLDPQRMFFTSADIEKFDAYGEALDDYGREGELSPAFEIFNVYEARLRSRLTQVVEQVGDWVAGYDFEREEFIEVDGSELPWADKPSDLDDRWRKRVKNQVLSLKLADKPDDEIVPMLERRYTSQLNRLDQYNAQDVFQVYANALTELFDPHTSYFSPRRAENFDINMSLSFDGIGAVLQVDDEFTKIARLVPAGPAEKQGDLQPSQLIVGVGQGNSGPITDVVGWRLDEVVDLIRGPRDTIVRLEVIPDKMKTDQRQVIAIRRNQVKLEEQSAQSDIIEVPDVNGDVRKIGVIDIPAFYIDFAALRRGDDDYKSTTRDVRRLIGELEADGVEGLVIDLRNNGGGSLQEANELTGLFIEYGPTVQIRSAERRVWRDGKRRRSAYYDGPVAVLINRLSASASEIFAGALQDYGRAIVVGDRTFGKGTVQTMMALPEGQLKVTESKFYRVSGDSTQHRGVVPDISYPSLFDPEQIGESSLDNALDWDQISPVRHREYNFYGQLLPTLQQRHEERVSDDPDFIFLTDQVAMAAETRSLTQLPLSEQSRVELREAQEAKALAIENKRRKAKGLELLTSLSDAPADPLADEEMGGTEGETGGDDALSVHSDPIEDDSDTPDVLLIETGRILADAMALSAPASERPEQQTAAR